MKTFAKLFFTSSLLLFNIIFLANSIQAQNCNCNEYIYLNDVFGDLTHKFLVNTPTGNLTEIGNPWLAANTIDNPHGIASDINGNLYIADNASGEIFKISCEGTLLEPDPVIPNPFNGTELRTTNFFSRDNILYVVSQTEEQILAFDLCDYSLIGRMDVDGGQDIQTWGFYIDGNNWYVPNRAAGNTNRMISGSLDMSLYTDPATNSGSTLFDFEDGMPVGMTIDSDGNFYVIEDQNGIATLDNIKINKYASDGTFITGITTSTNDGDNLNDGLEGWWGARGIVYSEATDQLYVSSQENCIAVFDTDLTQLETLNLGNPTGGNPKAIGIVTECCPTAPDLVIDVTLCSQIIGDKIFLQNITGCEGTICEGVWGEDASNMGLIYDPCDNSVTIDDLNACGAFTLGGNGSACGVFLVTINIDILPYFPPDISGISPTCANNNDPDPITISPPSAGSGTLTYRWQSSTTSCSSGFSDIAGAPTDGTPYDPPILTQETYYRVILEAVGACSGGTCELQSLCITLTPEADCGPTCTLMASCSSVNVSSCSPMNGSVSVSVSGDQGNVTYDWRNSANAQVGTTSTVNGLGTGTYTVIVTDDFEPDCTATCMVTVGSDVVLPSANCSATDNTSCDTPNGTASVSTNASNPSYEWSTGATTMSISGMTPGIYTVTVTDDDTGCINTCDATVGSGTADPSLACSFTDNTSCTTPNGTVTATASNVSYAWSNGATTSMISNLASGTYTVTVTDLTTGCISTCSETIGDPNGPTSCAVNVDSQPTCASPEGGAISVSVVGGTMPYSYSWSNGGMTAGLTGLPGGNYSVTVTDANSCTVVCQGSLITPVGCCMIEVSCTKNQDVQCFGESTGSATVNFTGALGNISFSWSTGATTQTVANLPSGTHSVTVSDDVSPGCEDICSVIIEEPTSLSCSTSSTGVLCNGGSSGEIVVTAVGGTSPYEYSTSNQGYQSSNTFVNMTAGDYIVTVRDANGCITTCNVTVAESTMLSCGVTATDATNCFDNNGSLVVSGTGGTGPYNYSIDNTTYYSSNTFNNLGPGNYTVFVRDANGCISECLAIIEAPAVPLCEIVSVTNITCNGDNIGSITAEGYGASGIYEYSLNGGMYQLGGTFNGLIAGSYTITVRLQGSTDCTSLCNTVITEPAALSCSTISFDAACSGDNSGSISVIASGGSGNYEFMIGNGSWQLSPTFNDLSASNYTVTVRDILDTDCTTICTALIEEPQALSCNATSDAVLCFGDNTGLITVTATGGIEPYEYSVDGSGWQGTGDFINMTAGAYTVIVRDANLCITECMVTVLEPTVLSCDATPTDATNCNIDDGSISVTAGGGTTPYEYSINNTDYSTSGNFPNLGSGSYTVFVRDANGCVSECLAVIDAPLAPLCEVVNVSDVVCFGENNGSIEVQGYGGGPGSYEYSLNGGTYQMSGMFNNLVAGSYTITVRLVGTTDCISLCNAMVEEPPLLECVLSTSDVDCFSNATGEIEVEATGGSGNYEYSIDGGTTWQIGVRFLNLTAGNYTIQTRDNLAPSCSVSCMATIIEPQALECSIAVQNVDCSTNMDGEITVTAINGTGPYEYSLDGSTYQPGNVFTGLPAGSYTATVRDANLCLTTCSEEIIEDNCIFDLALEKVFSTSNNAPIIPGSEVTFTIKVTNQGTIDAYNIELVDYIPVGLELLDSDWTLTSPTVATLDNDIDFIGAGEQGSANITFRVMESFQGTEIINYAEILNADDDNDPSTNGPIDEDSVPGDNEGDDELADDGDIVDNDTGSPQDDDTDSDDYDPELITITQEFDLALEKVYTSWEDTDMDGMIDPGEAVTYTITVYNQGTLDATDVVIRDYVSGDMIFRIFDNPLWTGGSSTAPTTTIANLAAGSQASVTIVLEVDPGFMGSSIINNAEIISADNALGQEDEDSPLSVTDGSADDDSELDTDNDTDDEAPGTPGDFDNVNDVDDYDPAEITVGQRFDLALIKTFNSSSATPIVPGTEVTFDLTVYNQGTLDAYRVNVNDYIPTGLTLNDSDWTEVTGVADLNSPIAFIAAGDEATVSITFTVDASFMGTSITNNAEISDADDDMDPNNEPPTDVDSTPDNEDGDTPDPNNDDVDDTNGNDDYDPETIDVEQTFDLALVKTLSTGTVVTPGDDVTFNIEVFNQGTVDAYNVFVKDYFPTDLILNDAGWTVTSTGVATLNNDIDFIAEGESSVVSITFTVSPDFQGTSILNDAEISAADNDDDPTNTPLDDVDSTPDDNDTPLDTANDDDTTDVNGGDDQDPAEVVVTQEFDLALDKVYTSWEDTDMNGAIDPGEAVTYTITVYNQGTLDATDVVIRDYVSGDMIFRISDNPLWTGGSSTAPTTTIANLAAGSQASVTIVLEVDPDFMGSSIINNAEIISADNALGQEDEDSPLSVTDGSADDDSELDTDNDTDDEAPGTPGDFDNVNDVDDYDPAEITVGQRFDLALIKTFNSSSATPIVPGTEVTFDLTVYNQGTLDAYRVNVNDYIPTGLTLNDSDWTEVAGVADLNSPIAFIAAGDEATVSITFTVDADFMGTSITNNAEISDADDDMDPTNDPPTDVDSTPDNEDGDTPDPNNDDVDDTNGNDDYDPETIDVDQTFDLALEKKLTTNEPILPGDVITFEIEVTNQGTVDAFNVEVVDYYNIAELELVSTGTWEDSNLDGIATLINDIDFVAEGEMVSVPVSFRVQPDFMGTQIINWAEISGADNDNDPTNTPPVDVDSTPNDDQFSEGGESDDLDDDGVIDEDGLNGGDEDDHDPAPVTVTQVFDLALEKLLDGWDDTDMNGMIDPGENVTFRINIYNQGNLDASDIEVADYVPTGMLFNQAENADFLNTGAGTASIPVATVASLGMGEDAALFITLQVDPMFMGNQAINNAEIVAATNLLGIPDEDDDLANINGVADDGSELDTDNDIDDEFDGTPGTEDNDEDIDDYDPVLIPIGQMFDLALTKVYDSYNDLSGDGVLSSGDEVTFSTTIFNQGTLDAFNIQISDYIPDGLTLTDANWNNTQNVNIAQLNTVIDFLAAGDQIELQVTFTIDEFYRNTSIVNFAEISAADDNDDPTDGFPDDIDSTPNTNDEDDTFGGDNVIDNTNNDEDDHDPAEINPVIEFDLALAKKDQSDLPLQAYGETRVFDIEVTNQGTVYATEFEIIDYIPCGFEWPTSPGSNPGWVYNASNNTATFLYDETILSHGDMVTLELELTVVECVGDLEFNYTNYAEIIDYDDDFDDFNPDLNDVDSDPDATNFDDAGGVAWTDSDDYIDGDGTGQSGINNPGVDVTDEDDHDPERVELFDLALIKELNTAGPYNYGMDLEFQITVCNQGNIGAQNVEVIDYLPAGYSFDFADQTGPWSGTATQPVYTIATIAVDACESFTMILTIEMTDGGEKDWINYAEILSAENEFGEDRTDYDIDSNPGSNNATENGVEPGDAADNDLTSQDDGGEEDDHDPAGIEIFDLAQTKTTTSTGPFVYGDEVIFTFTVYNQGSIEASNIELTDYIPCGYQYQTSNDANGWSYDMLKGKATIELPGTLAAGASTTMTIALRLQQCLDMDESTFTNVSEISDAESTDPDEPADDIDSTPNDDPTDDGGPTDDDINGDPNNPANPDEDDSDPETLNVFDLALRKTVDNVGPYVPGEKATFTIEVFNQGNVTASNFTITDYLNTGFIFNLGDNPGWTMNGSLLTYDVTTALLPDASTSVDLVLEITIPVGATPSVWINEAEVSYAEGPNGNNTTDGTLVDSDSTPDNNPDNDNDVQPGDDNDNVIDENINDPFVNGDNDEDDNDIAHVIVGYDLALSKTTTATAPFTYGQAIAFDITLYNQGGLAASNIEITEYIPCGYVFESGLNAGWTYDTATGYATYVYTNVLAPSTSDVVTIVLRLNQCTEAGAFTNVVEISDFDDENGDDPVIDDYDSTPDNDPNNDGPVTDNEVDGNPSDPSNPDEDDNDIENLEIFDLAFIKYIEDKGPYGPGDIAEYKMVVYNQGNVAAYNVEVTDYLNEGYVFDPSINAGWAQTGDLVQTTIAGPIAAGGSVELTLNLEVIVPDGASIASWYNEGEISGADNDTDPTNPDPIDADSTPDTDPDNDNDLVDGPDEDPIFDEEDDNDNVIDEDPNDPFGNGDDDEDDNDAADILVVGGLGDTVFKDLDGDGIRDANEPGVAGVIATLTDCEGNVIATQVTDSEGFFFFNNLIPGDYQVSFDISQLVLGCDFTYQDVGTDDEADSDVNLDGVGPCVSIEGGEYDSTYDAGLLILASLGDYVWYDLDGDGVQDGNEPGIGGVVVNLYDGNGNFVATTTTDNTGYYLFDLLYPGDYYLEFVTPDGYELTFPNMGINDGTDSDVDGSNGVGTTTITTLEPGENDPDWDAGYYICVPLGDLVWYDLNENDIWDTTENGINGLVVNLWRQNTDGTYNIYDTQYTGHKPGTPSDDGYYKFCAPPGTYYVEIVLPPYGLVPAVANVGNNEEIDNDVTNANGVGTTSSFTVLSGQEKCDLGHGYYPMAQLGDRAWQDVNENGIQDAGEQALPGVQVRAFNSEGVQVGDTKVTAADGSYNMDYLGKDDYYLEFTPPSGFATTIANVGSDEQKDSDVDNSYGLNTTGLYSLQPGDEIPTVDVGFRVSNVLPIEWASFTAENRGEFNQLDWTTANEINNSHFEVERRFETEADYVQIGKVAGSGTTTEETDYDTQDYDIAEDGVYYYRLRQVDFNGKSDYSHIVSVRVDRTEAGTIEIYPNPTVDMVNIDVTLREASDIKVSIWDADGKLVRANVLDAALKAGFHNNRVDISYLINGVYTVRVQIGSQVINKRLIVLKG